MSETLVLPSGAVVVPGYGGLFAVTEDGRVFATRFGRYGKAATISESVARGVKAFLKGRPMTPGAQAAAARAFGVSKNVVQGIASGRTWRHV